MSLKSSPASASLLHDVYLAVIPWFKAMLTEVPEDVAVAVKAIDSAVMAAVPHCHYCADLSIVRPDKTGTGQSSCVSLRVNRN